MKLGFFIEEFIFLGISSKKYLYSASGGILKIFLGKTNKIWKWGGGGICLRTVFFLFIEYFFRKICFFSSCLGFIEREKGEKKLKIRLQLLNLLLCLKRRQFSLKSNHIFHKYFPSNQMIYFINIFPQIK